MLHQAEMPLGTAHNILEPFKAVVSHCIDVSEWINNLGFQCQRLIALAWKTPKFFPSKQHELYR